MSHMTQDQQKLVKARKAARAVFSLMVMIGGILFVLGIYTQFLPTVYDGLIAFAASIIPWFFYKKIEKKLNAKMV